MAGSKSASEGSCLSYEERWVNIFFTDEEVCCKYCPLLETYARKQCRRTGEYIINDNIPGYWCPLLKAENGSFTNPETGEVIQT